MTKALGLKFECANDTTVFMVLVLCIPFRLIHGHHLINIVKINAT